MAPKRGLSLEEKRTKVLNIFMETKEVYQIKDIEKLAAKQGVVLQTVKDVVESLVNDDLIHEDRIGISKYYWAFPGERAVKLDSSIKQTGGMVQAAISEQARLREQLAACKQGVEDADLRAQKLEELKALKQQAAEAEKQLAQYADNDPALLKEMQESVEVAKAAANRWLDNLWALKGWCRKSFEGQEAEMDDFFKTNGYSEDMDYV